MPRGGSKSELRGYGELKARAGAGGCDKTDQGEGDFAQMLGAGVDAPRYPMMRRARNGVIPA